MKRSNNISTLCVGLFLMLSITVSNAMNAAEPVTTGNSQTILGEYTIVELAPETIANTQVRVFQLTYQNGTEPIKIYLDERAKCREYIVRSNVMEVQYTCNKQGFGAKLVNSKYSLIPEQVNNMFLSTENLKYQSRISDGNIPVEKALGLIACYYPSLLKNIQNIASVN